MSDLTPEKLAELRRLARSVVTTVHTPWYCADDLATTGVGPYDDAAYIAALPPATVLELLDAAADADKWQRAALTLQGDRDALRAELAHMTEARDNARAEVERLTAMVAEVRATAEHYDGRAHANAAAAILRALDGKADQ